MVPDDFEGLLVIVNCTLQTAVPGGSHHDLSIGKQLRRLGTSFPKDDFALDGVKLLEGAVNAFRRAEHLVNIGRGNAIGNQEPTRD